jgi:hypothetical protein
MHRQIRAAAFAEALFLDDRIDSFSVLTAAALDTHFSPALNLRTFISAVAALQTSNRNILLNVGFLN